MDFLQFHILKTLRSRYGTENAYNIDCI